MPQGEATHCAVNDFLALPAVPAVAVGMGIGMEEIVAALTEA